MAIINGTSGNDTRNGTAGDDQIFGLGGNDVLAGLGGADLIDGGTGTDTATYAASLAGVNVSLATGVGSGGDAEGDTLVSIENLTGSGQNDTLEGDGGNNVLAGGAGVDTVSYEHAAAGVTVSLALTSAQNTVGAGTDTLSGFENLTGSGFDDTLTGNTGANVLIGGAGNDTLNGGTGADTLIGGIGNDTYVVDNVGDVVTEAVDEGTDTVQSSVSYTLGDNVENLTLLGSANLSGTGNAADNIITGNSGNNVLAGLGGADTLIGNTGTDTATYAASSAGVNVSLTTGLGSGGDAEGDTLANIENLTGSAFDDTLEGNGGANVLAGGAGIDTVTYEHAAAGVTVSLALTTAQNTVGAGSDTLSGFENLTGSAFNDTLTGNAGANVINGLDGNDTLAGLGGADTLDGGTGSDTASYAASSAGVNVSLATGVGSGGDAQGDTLVNIENLTGSGQNDTLEGNGGDNVLAGGAGTDTVSYEYAAAGVTVSLALTTAQNTGGAGSDTLSAFENLTGSHFDNILTGNTGANVITSFEGNDTLDGGAGADTLIGGAGNDTYIVDNAGDVVTEAADEGTDTVQSSISYTLGANVENLTLTGTGNLNATGNAADNVIIGNVGNNVLAGLGGADTLIGNIGTDTATYAASLAGVNVSLATGLGSGGDAEGDTLASIENLTGSGQNDTLEGDGGNNVLAGGAGTDTVSYEHAAAGVTVSLALTTAQNTVGAGSDTLSAFENLTGSAFDDTLTGNTGANVLTGGAGNDTLNGGTGADTLIGGIGNDTYVVDNAGDVVTEAVGEGIDSVQSSVSYALGDNVENLTLTGTGALSGTGNADSNIIVGNSGANILAGLGGADILDGGAGTDTATYAASLAGVNVSLTTGVGTGGDAEGDTLTNFENLTGSAFDDALEGNGGSNVLAGGAGTDRVSYEHALAGVTVSLALTSAQNTGGAGSDTLSGFENLTGSAFNDTLTGDAGGNVIIGLEGDDTVAGLGGADALDGGSGIDTATYAASLAGVNVSLVTGVGSGGDAQGDTLVNIENLTGSGQNDTLEGDGGNNVLAGGAGTDTVSYEYAAAGVTVSLALTTAQNTGGAGSDTLSAFENLTGSHFDNVLTGSSAANVITSFEGNDTLDGGAGADTMIGGAGNDTYVVDNIGDVVTEAADVGTDTVQSSISYALGANVENLTLTGTGNLNATGNAADNVIIGNVGNNVLAGLGGADTLIGNIGTDTATYAASLAGVNVSLATGLGSGGDAEGDTLASIENLTGSGQNDTLEGDGGNNVLAGGAGTDTVSYEHAAAGVTVSLALTTAQNTVGAGSDTLSAFENLTGSAFDDTLTGNTGANVLTGGAGNDTLNGGTGADTLIGGIGNDTYVVDNAGDAVTEAVGEGTDTVQSSINYTLGADVENLTLTGTGGLTGTGNAADNIITGNTGSNVLAGLGGADALDGGAGTDTATYAASLSGVTVNLSTGLGSGGDAEGDTLANIENLIGAHFDNVLTGSSVANVITSFEGNDTLDGGAGADTLIGGAGNDTYVVDNTADVVTEAAGEGIDTVQSSISYTLGSNVENLTLTGTGNLNGTGNADNNTIIGNAGNNTLTGLGGADSLDGGAGSDTATYAASAAGVSVSLATGIGSGGDAQGDTLVNIENLTGSGQNDTLEGDGGNNVLAGGAGTDTVSYEHAAAGVTVNLALTTAQDTVGAGTDTLSAFESLTGSAFDDTLTAGNGANILIGGAGNDNINAGGGADTLIGGAGNDTLTGGAQADTFVYATGGGADFISDFTRSQGDRIDLTGLSGIYGLVDIQSRATQQGSDTLIDFGGGNTITLANNTVGSLVASDFIFAANSAPTDIALSNTSVAENSAAGTVVGALSDVDADAGDTATFTLLDNAGGLFAIDSGNLVVAGALDYETAQSYQVTVRVTDSANHTFDKIFTIAVTDVAGVTLTGDENANTLVGTAEADTLNGLGGNDRLQGLADNDQLNGGLGFDRAIYSDATGAITVNMAAGTVTGAGVGSDTLTGVEGIVGSDFADTFDATGFTGWSGLPGVQIGQNEFEGRGGDDVITGIVNVQGQALTRATYLSATAAVTADIAAGTADGDASVGHDTFSHAYSIWGSAYNDTLYGSDTAFGTFELFEGRAGDDYIDGRGGYDRVDYANDSATTSGITVHLAAGTVVGDASVGTDTIRNVEAARGTNFDDIYDATGFGSAGALNVGYSGTFNDFAGAGGNDTIIGNGATRLNYALAAGSVTVDLETSAIGTTNAITVAGSATGVGEGTDTFTGVNAVQGSTFADTLLGSVYNNTFTGLGGDDYIDGRGGFDTVSYNSVSTGTGGVTINFAAGTATGDASIGADTFRNIEGAQGTNFADSFNAIGYGQAGALNISTSNGNFNQFEGLAGNDTITGNGNTRLVYTNAAAAVTVDIAAGTATGDASVGTDTFTGVNSVNGSAFADTLLGSGNGETFLGLAGNDVIDGRGGFDTAQYSGFNTTGGVSIDLASGTVTGDASVGTDTLLSIESVQGTNFADTFVATGFGTTGANVGNNGTFNQFQGFAGNDIITGNGNTQILFNNATGAVNVNLSTGIATGDASVGTDTITGGVNNVVGSNFNDTIVGSSGNETLNGGSGNDTISGGGGADNLFGNAGADTFVYATGGGSDFVGDFVHGQGDRIDVTGVSGIYSLADIQSHATQQGSNTLIDFGNGDTITLQNITVGSLVASDFIFAANSAPTDIGLSNTSVAENSAANTVVGSLSAVDPDAGDTASFTLVDDANGLFAISGGNLVVAGALDYETATSHQVTVRVTDSANHTYDKVFTIAVTDVAGVALTGDDNVNTLIGTTEADTLNGLGGNDRLQGLADNDQLNGGFGFDRAVYTDATGGITVNMAAGTVTGAGVGSDTLTGVEGVVGSDFADTYNSAGFTGDSVTPGTPLGFNEFEGRGGDDTITGNLNSQGAALTRVAYVNATSAVTVDLALGTAVGDTSVGHDTLVGPGFNGVWGSGFDDTIRGTDNAMFTAEVFAGFAGNDLIDGRGGFDRADYNVNGATAAGIVVNLAAGTVTGDATVGTDTLLSIEAVRGTNLVDTYNATGFSGSSTNAGSLGTFNEFTGNGGDDIITGNGNTRLGFNNATAGVTVDFAAGFASGDASVGNDTFTGVNAVQASMFDDTLLGGATNDTFTGLAGNDFIDGRGGFDVSVYNNIFFTTGGVTVHMAAGTVTGDASSGTDTLRNIEGVQGTMLADSFDATGYGQVSALNISTSNGNFNQFEGLGGDDIITGNGNTRVLYSNSTAGVTITIGAGGAGSAHGTAAGDTATVGNDSFTGGVNTAIGSNFGDVYNAAAFNNGFNSFQGNGGDDQITGNGVTQVQYGNATSGVTITIGAGGAGSASGDSSVGNDTFTGGVNSAIGGGLADSYNASGYVGFNSFQGNSGNDTITGNGATQIIYGNATSGVSVNLSTGIATGDGSVGTDTITGGVNNVFGSNFGDTIIGSSGNDFLNGGNGGNDTLSGGGGADNLFGGTGADTFVYATGGGSDFVSDFLRGQGDRIDVTGVTGIYSLTDVQAHASQQGSNTLIDFGNGDTITLANVIVGSLVASDFVFAANSAPTDIALSNTSVAENSAANTVVGLLFAVDPDAGDTASFTLVDDANGLFAINGGNLVVAGALDYETAQSYQVTVRVTDSAAHTYDKIFTIDVTDVAGVTLTGDENANTLVGTGEADTLTGLGGNDRLQGLADNDALDGGAGFDRAIYSDATGAITVNLAAGTVTGAGVGSDTLTGVEGIVGSDFADTFNATGFTGSTGQANIVTGQNEFEGRGGDDVIIGNINALGQSLTRINYLEATGAVTVDIAAGTADGDASVGHDTFSNVSTVWGSASNDTFYGSNNANFTYETYDGRGGDDYIDGRGGYDSVNYNNDPATTSGIVVHLAAGTVNGDASVGTDTIRNVEAARGTNFDDVFDATGYGLAGALNVSTTNGNFNDFGGAGGNDTIIGNGNTRLNYQNAAASVTVDLETSAIGTTNAITVAGSATGTSEGTDTFTGVNAVQGSMFGDTLRGSSFNNTFTGLGGDDFIDGRGGFDTASYNSLSTVTSGVTVNFAAGTVTGDSSIGTDTLRNIEGVQGTMLADTFNAAGYGQTGALNISTSNGNFNQFEGLGGDDTITGNGNTRVIYSNATAGVTITIGAGGAGSASGDGSVGNDSFTGGVNSAIGGNFADTYNASTFNNGFNSFQGNGGNDTITGNGATQVVYGNATSGVTITIGAGGAGSASGDGSVGSDTFTGGVNSAVGGGLADSYNASGFVGFNSFQGQGGNDTITGNGATQVQYGNATAGVNVNLATGIVTGDASVGTDTITGGVFNVFGSNFGDTITGGSGNDVLNGGNGGNDTLNGGGGADNLFGGSGADTFVYATGGGSDFVGDFVHGQGDRIDVTGVTGIYSLADIQSHASQQGSNTLIDFGNGDTVTLANIAVGSLVAGDFVFNSITGTPGNDVLVGTSQVEGIFGLDGNDRLQGLAGNDWLDGGNGFDRAIYSDATGPVTVNLAAGTASGAGVGTDTLVNIEGAVGSDFNDTFDATGFSGSTGLPGVAAGQSAFEGRGGDDVITGRVNDLGQVVTRVEYLSASAAVTVDLAAGTGQGTAAGDVANVGHDTFTNTLQGVYGSAYNDTIYGSDNAPFTYEVFEGRGGDDYIDGRGGYDIVTYNNDVTTTSGITVHLAAGTVTGDATVGTDTLRNVEAVRGTNFDDVLDATGYGLAGALNVSTTNGNFNELAGAGGNDTIIGNGNTRLNYSLALAAVTVDLETTAGTAITVAGSASGATEGTDTFTGVNAVQASMFGDTLLGSSFNNTFIGLGGDDYIDGRGGFDTASYNHLNTVTGGVTVNMAAGTATGDASIGTDTLRNIEGVQGTMLADTYDATGYGLGGALNVSTSNGNFNQFEGLGGDDTVTGNGNTRVLYNNSTAGVTITIGAGGAGSAHGTAAGDAATVGNDTFTGGVNSAIGSNFGDVYDASAFNNGFNSFQGNGGDDQITGNGATQILFSNAAAGVVVDLAAGTADGDSSVGHDTITGGVNSVFGSNFNDTILGSSGNDFLNGGNGGNDTLNGGGGADNLFGGAGADTFVYADGGGADFISDFNHGQGDRIDVTGVSGVFALADIQSRASQQGLNTLIDFGGGNAITLQNVALADLVASDFVFNSITGTSGNDVLVGTSQVEGIFGLDGNDRLQGLAGNDWLDGGNGFDRAIYSDATGPVTVNLAAGTASAAGAGTDTLVNIEGAVGSDFNDTFDATGFTGSTGLPGVAAGQSAFEGRGGDDVITGRVNALGQVVTRVEYLSASAAVTVDLAAGTGQGTAAGDVANVGHDTFTNTLQGVYGSAYNDTIYGSDNAPFTYEVFEGRGGDDYIDGRGGYDIVTYNNDVTTTSGITVHLAAGTVTGDATVGTDTLRNVEAVRGTNFDDVLDATGYGLAGALNVSTTNGNFNELAGAGGNDTIIGNGNTRLNYSLALAAVTVDLETTAGTAITVAGSASGATEGTDTFTGVNAVQASMFGDTLLGSSFNNTFIGLGGDDYIDGRGGFDTASYNHLNTVTGGVTVNMAAGTATGDASIGTDTLRNIEGVQGTMLADTYDATGYGLGGALNVSTSNGNFNQFEGLGGDDTITGNGNTRVLYSNATAGVTITIDAGGAGSAHGDASVGNDTFTGGVNAAIGSNSGDVYDASAFNGGFNSIQGNGGDDTVTGNGATQVQYGNASSGVTITIGAGGAGSASGDGSVGNDTFTGGVNSAIGGGLADSYNASGFTGFNSFQGQGGNDTITGNGATQIQYSNATGGVTVNLSTGIATGDGSVGTDTITGGVNSVLGSNSADTITGSSANETLNGNGGNDTLNGGGGADLLFGNAGNDKFVFTAGAAAGATIGDFAGNGAAAGDSLEFHGFGLATDANAPTLTWLSGNQWQIHSGLDGHDEVITLTGSNASSVHLSDYQFLT